MGLTRTRFTIAVLGGLLSSTTAYADVWLGGTSSDWTVNSNWQDNSVPLAADDVHIVSPATNPLLSGAVGNANDIYIGDGAGANGSFLLMGGADLNNVNTYIGYDGGTGAASVQNSATTWDITNSMVVGYFTSSTGSLSISRGAVTNVDGYVGHSGGDGSVTLSTGAEWINSGFLSVGFDTGSQGDLLISSGSTVQSDFMSIGQNGGEGAVVVTDSGSLLQTSSTIYIGYINGGGGTLDIMNTAGAITGDVIIGYVNGANGQATVSDAGYWNAHFVYVGSDDSAGALSILSGSTMTAERIYIGDEGDGTLLIDGPGTLLMSPTLIYVGWLSGSTGSMTVSNGGAAASDLFSIGDSGGSGTLLVTDDSSIVDNSTGDFYLADNGLAVATIANGGRIFSINTYAGLNGGDASILLTGSGSAWTNSASFAIGTTGTASLSVEDGGLMTSDVLSIGQSAGGNGSLIVTGAGSEVTTNYFYVGETTGTGSVIISNGGLITSNITTSLGQAGGEATFVVTGSGSLFDSSGGEIDVWNGGNALLVISDGGEVRSASSYISGGGGSTGIARVTGTGSVWNNTSSTNISDGGMLTLSDGGTFNTDTFLLGVSGVGILNIGADPADPAEAPGILNVTTGPIVPFGGATGRINFNHTGTAYDFASDISGAVEINNYAGTTVLGGQATANLGTSITGGRLIVNDLLASNVTVAAGAVLGGSGEINGTIVNDGDIIPGALLSSGNYATLQLDNDYTGNAGSALRLRTALGNDASPTDRIYISGADVFGSTTVFITNDGGLGAQTTGDGIRIIQGTGTPISSSAFTLNGGYVQAGLYQYQMYQGGSTAGTEYDFYLRSAGLAPSIPVYAAMPSFVASYSQQMLSTLQERMDLGDTLPGAEKLALGFGGDIGDMALAEGVWVRGFGGFTKFKAQDAAGSGYDGTIAGMQVGKDVYRSDSENGSRNRAGIYVAQAHAEADLTSNAGDAGESSFNATSLGGYWTHYMPSKTYISAAAQYSRIHAMKISPNTGNGISPGGNVYSASLETGRPFAFGRKNRTVIEPQLQVIYQHLKIADANDGVAAIDFGQIDTITTRAGIAARHAFDTAGGLTIQPWTRLNVLHTFEEDSVLTLDGTSTFTTPLEGTQGEIQLGLSLGRPAEKDLAWSLYLTGGYQFDITGASAKGWTTAAGVRFNW